MDNFKITLLDMLYHFVFAKKLACTKCKIQEFMKVLRFLLVFFKYLLCKENIRHIFVNELFAVALLSIVISQNNFY